MKKIGVLLPQSKAYQTIGKDFINGLRLSQNEDYNYIIQGIGLGNEVQPILDAIDKLCLQEDVSSIIGFVGDNNLINLYEKVNSLEIPTIFVRLGAFPNISVPNNKYAFTLSFGICEAINGLGKWFVDNGFKQVAIAGSFNDIGYGFSEALEKPLYEAGGEFAGHHVPPINPRENEAELAEEFYQSTEFDIACEFFNGVYAQENAEYIASFKNKIDKPFIFSPFGLNEPQLKLVSKKVDRILMFASWVPVELKGEAASFDNDFFKKYDKYPSVHAMLGYEAHLLLDEALNKRKSILDGEILNFNSPRGACTIDGNLNITTQQRIWEAETNEDTVYLKELNTLSRTNDTPGLFEGQETGWHNAYLCY